MKSIKICIIIMCLVFITKSSFALESDSLFFQSMLQFAGKKELKYSASYSYFNDYKQSKPDKVVRAKFVMKDSLYYWNLGDVEILKSKFYTTIIDHDSKTLMVDKASSTKSTNLSKGELDSMLKTYDSLIIITDDLVKIVYRVYSKAKGISYMDVSITKKTLLFSSMKIYFMDFRNNNMDKQKIRNRLEIMFQNISSLNYKDLEYFNAENYYNVIENKKIVPVEKLKRYDIINHLKA